MTEARHWDFSADLQANGLSPDGRLTLTFVVNADDKYVAMPITDIRGKKFRIRVSTASSRVIAGADDIEAHKQRIKQKALDRKLAAARERRDNA